MTTTTDAIPKVDDLRTQGVAILRRLVGRNTVSYTHLTLPTKRIV